jgi:hypothetical protein
MRSIPLLSDWQVDVKVLSPTHFTCKSASDDWSDSTTSPTRNIVSTIKRIGIGLRPQISTNQP